LIPYCDLGDLEVEELGPRAQSTGARIIALNRNDVVGRSSSHQIEREDNDEFSLFVMIVL